MELETGSTGTSVGEIAWSRGGVGPSLVLVHGTPFNRFVWSRIAAVLAHRFDVLTPDLLGYGDIAALEPSWGAVRCLVFCAWGAEDTWLPSSQLRQLEAGGLPLRRIRLLPGAGHLVQHDAPEAVLGFIEECLAA